MEPKIFNSPNSSSHYTASLNCGLGVYPLVRGYKEAADILVQNLSETGGRSIDGLAYPICYLYRHHVEIFLKDIIQICGYLYDSEDADAFLLERSHSISRLWKKLKELLMVGGELEKAPEELTRFDELVSELSLFDPTGTSFRYHKDKEGKILLRDSETQEPIIYCDLLFLHNEIQKFSEILECVDMDLSVQLDCKRDYLREMQNY